MHEERCVQQRLIFGLLACLLVCYRPLAPAFHGATTAEAIESLKAEKRLEQAVATTAAWPAKSKGLS